MYILHHSVWHQALCQTASVKHFSGFFLLTSPFLSSAPLPLFCTVYVGVSSWMPTRSHRQAEALHIPPLPSPSHTSISSQQRLHYTWASYRSINTIQPISQRWDWNAANRKKTPYFFRSCRIISTQKACGLCIALSQVQWDWGECIQYVIGMDVATDLLEILLFAICFAGAERYTTRETFLRSRSSSSLWMRRCLSSSALSTQPSITHRPTSSRRSFWWTTTAMKVGRS